MQKASVLPFFGPGKNKKDPFSDVLHCMILSFCDGNYDSQPRHKYVRNKLENLFPHNLSPQSGVHIASVFITTLLCHTCHVITILCHSPLLIWANTHSTEMPPQELTLPQNKDASTNVDVAVKYWLLDYVDRNNSGKGNITGDRSVLLDRGFLVRQNIDGYYMASSLLNTRPGKRIINLIVAIGNWSCFWV